MKLPHTRHETRERPTKQRATNQQEPIDEGTKNSTSLSHTPKLTHTQESRFFLMMMMLDWLRAPPNRHQLMSERRLCCIVHWKERLIGIDSIHLRERGID